MTDRRRALVVALGSACALITAAAYGLQPLLGALIQLSFPVRVGVTVLLLGPLGLTLGMAMPLFITRLGALHPSGVVWAWGVNGIASVLASAAAVAIAIVAGFPAATLAALSCYLVAFAHAAVGRWPQREPVVAPVAAPVGPGRARRGGRR